MGSSEGDDKRHTRKVLKNSCAIHYHCNLNSKSSPLIVDLWHRTEQPNLVQQLDPVSRYSAINSIVVYQRSKQASEQAANCIGRTSAVSYIISRVPYQQSVNIQHSTFNINRSTSIGFSAVNNGIVSAHTIIR